jgi:hypothetical protein
MNPFKKDIGIRRGDTKEIFFKVRTKVWDSGTSAYVPGPYKDLTGYTITSQVREQKASVATLLTFTVTLGNQADLVDGRGAVFLKIDSDDTQAVSTAITKGVWDVQFEEPDGDKFTYIEGDVVFDEDVTRP